MIRLLLAALLVLPATLRAQTPPLRFEAGGEGIDVPAASHRGYPAYPAGALRALGAKLEDVPHGAVAVLFGDTLEFTTLSPFFRAAGRTHQLAVPVYREGGVLYLPRQLFIEWLPARYPRRLRHEAGRIELRPERSLTAGAGIEAASRPAPSGPTPGEQPPPPPDGRVEADRRGPARAPADAEAPRIVILDPGHGGRDPGKIGPNGVREKDVTLAISRRLAALLEERGGYEVHLTRTRDTLIALADRPHMANEWKAGRPSALFLSLHANSFSPRVRGFETYFLSEARTEDERRVAEMENAAIEYEDPGAAGPRDDLGYILNNLRNDFYLRASNDLAEAVQLRLEAFHPGPNRGVKQAPFRVLVGAFMPAALVEIAYLSNPEEAQLLASSAFQQKVAWALADAVDGFFSSHEHLWAAGAGR